jgi:hypothetical protein
VPKGHLYELLAAAATLAVVLLALAAFATPLGGGTSRQQGDIEPLRPRVSQLELFALGATVVTCLGFMFPDDFFYHCAAFLGPFLALVLGLAAGRLARLRPGPVLAVVAAVAVLGVIHALAIPLLLQRSPTVGDEVAAVIPAGSCVVADDAEYTLTANRFLSSSPDCPLIVDALGVTIAISGSVDPGSAQARAAAPTWLSYFRRADYVLLTPLSATRIPWDSQLESYLELHFRVATSTPVLILRRLATPADQPQFHLPGS